jgi:hypothetical protein
MNRRTFLSTSLASLAAGQSNVGLQLPDFSNCGYKGAGVKLPVVPTRIALKPQSGDATERIQAAIDKLSAMPLDQRGAVLLAKGQYEINGVIRIAASGIVFRGEGQGEDGTILIAAGKKPRSLFEVKGKSYGTPGRESVRILDEYVPVGAHSFRVASPKSFNAGQIILVRRIGNADWIRELGMDRIKSRPGAESTTRQWSPFNLEMERTITAIDGDRITIDAPVTCAIETRWGGGEVLAFDDSGRIVDCGVENFRSVSAFDRSVTAEYGREKEKYFSDEAHASDLVSIDNANNAWARNVTAVHFSFACVKVQRTRWITVQDCDCREMVSIITGSRRYSYSLSGQLALVQRCTSDTSRHDFVVGARVAGPNVFLDCKAGRSFATSEPHHRWSVCGLYDNVKADIAFQDRQWYGTGHGWAGANYVAWNCEGSLVCQNPPTAQNWAIGQVGKKEPGAFAPRPDGIWESYGKHVEPRSLYLHQLAARLGGDRLNLSRSEAKWTDPSVPTPADREDPNA